MECQLAATYSLPDVAPSTLRKKKNRTKLTAEFEPSQHLILDIFCARITQFGIESAEQFDHLIAFISAFAYKLLLLIPRGVDWRVSPFPFQSPRNQNLNN
eukprot:TRINITY_DN8031_c0_g1_i1.p1 TRINITY_DN8031_c0_g1~~TRINITY_DN8031_c0_g1_i1.p1  ORF type:complete len:100 (-),score=10.73 TRINITY_DN8031_c0_g1_i1:13-312(-)